MKRALILGCMVLMTALAAGCGARIRDSAPLDEASALALAVDLANAECEQQYSARPFDVSSYRIVFLGDRWHWGEIDPAGPGGFSGTASFDAFGEARRVQVVFHMDQLVP